MVFSSVIFLFLFLPVTLFLYSVCGRNLRNIVLLVASLFFYAWGEGIYLLIMLASIGLNYLCGRLILTQEGKPSKAVLIAGVTANLAILGFFKYANFIVANVNSFLQVAELPVISMSPVHLPIGISFFTFQAISYIADVYRQKDQPQKNIITLGLYISLFPQLIAGPIVRYNTIAADLVKRQFDLAKCAYGIRRFIYGLSKKVLLANPLAEIADKIFALPAAELSPSLAWLGALCYTLQIYFDFSGYFDMAIGLGRIFGFHFLENFNYPYIARSIREFWRRWHISLSTWLRDYLYIPLGGNRKGEARTYVNLLIVFLLCGLWHGASWTFVCWGLFHGFFLALERTAFGRLLASCWRPFQHIWTLLIVMVGWVLFRCETIEHALAYLRVMAGLAGTENIKLTVSMLLASKLQLELVVGIVLAIPLYPFISKMTCTLRERVGDSTVLVYDLMTESIHLLFVVALFYATVISLAAGVYNPFIYFRF